MNDVHPSVDLEVALANANRRLEVAYDELDQASQAHLLAEELGRENAALKAELDACYRELSELVVRMQVSAQAGPDSAVIADSVLAASVHVPAARAERGVLARLRGRFDRFLLRRKAEKVRRSGLFDATWYLMHYPDVAEARMDPVEHYLLFGVAEGRQVNAYIDMVQYVARNPDAAADPLTHLLSKRRRA